MFTFFGKKYDYSFVNELAIDFNQIAGVKNYEYADGRSRKARAVDVKTGSGLQYTILLDRALDIANVEFKGIPLAYTAQPGIVSPQYYNPEGKEWLRSFIGGLFTTCGLTNVGDACEFNGVKYGQHGIISHLPGEKVNIDETFDGTDYAITVSGKIRQVKAFIEDTVLHRSITSYAGKNTIRISDVVENRTGSSQPFMLLYHFNFGFPLMNENSGIIIPHLDAKEPGKTYMTNPVELGKDAENVNTDTSLFKPVTDQNKDAYFMVTNDMQNPELAILVKYNSRILKNLITWKYIAFGNYIVCIEPANCRVKGIASEHENGTLQYLAPFDKQKITMEINILCDRKEIFDCQKRLEALR